MELVTCPNCLTVYGGANELCPGCDADRHGQGARVELDVTARAAVARQGGLFGGILEVEEGTWLLWCAHGLCWVSDEAGLVWERSLGARVDGVRVEDERVRVVRGGSELLLARADGSLLR